MIRDANCLDDLRREWHSVRKLEAELCAFASGAFASGAWFVPYDTIYALLLPFGFSALENTLQQMRDEQLFASKSTRLQNMMEASRSRIAWADYDAVDRGRDVRNKLTHEQVIPLSADTFRILDEIERELIGWAVLSGPVKYECTLSQTRSS
jgi:hypothetical protein